MVLRLDCHDCGHLEYLSHTPSLEPLKDGDFVACAQCHSPVRVQWVDRVPPPLSDPEYHSPGRPGPAAPRQPRRFDP